VRIDEAGERHSLAVAQAFVRNQGDAWTWTLNQFKRTVDDLATHEASTEARADNVEDYNAFAATIGRQLAAMHVILARKTDNEAFAPRLSTARDTAQWTSRAKALLNKAFEVIAKRKTGENEADDAAASELLANKAQLLSALERLAKAGTGTLLTRIHGDFHLGQILVATGDAYIIDFEGEPGRPLAERRAKMSPLQDVAGLLRSLDYAVATTLDPKTPGSSPLPETTRVKFMSRLRDGASRAFYETYSAGAKKLKGVDNLDLLLFFMVEKAAYEVVYEAANRPPWLSVPLQGLHRLATRIFNDDVRDNLRDAP
jgi:maltose alpha-D-glucosyltransferase/alpha-amylase